MTSSIIIEKSDLAFLDEWGAVDSGHAWRWLSENDQVSGRIETLRQMLRGSYTFTPDDSHGQGWRNAGVEAALHHFEEWVGGRDWEAPCEPSGDPDRKRETWCLTHGGPMPQRVYCCQFAQAPWTWRESRSFSEHGSAA